MRLNIDIIGTRGQVPAFSSFPFGFTYGLINTALPHGDPDKWSPVAAKKIMIVSVVTQDVGTSTLVCSHGHCVVSETGTHIVVLLPVTTMTTGIATKLFWKEVNADADSDKVLSDLIESPERADGVLDLVVRGST